ncbi:amidohydrolase family protein [Microbacterium hominis]|uniref:Amidohydrolase family protein n=1 Tax=Microbacterium hominis TaxID=162426 RepID=A0A7D4TEW2_9MICO|nr:amidohydrolase family protein [Microbacterium hominis]QKJ18241.1 amidohydrolase family protein [Microbacterium hominis]
MVAVKRVVGCRVADPDVEGLVDILIEAGRIREILPASGSPAGAGDLDACGMVAVPGLTNAHTHTPLSLMKGAAEDVSVDDWFNKRVWPMEMNLTPERVKIGARLACAEMLLGGVTGFADHYFFADQIAAAAQELGIRANIAPTFFSEAGGASRERAFDQTRAIVEMDSRLVTASVGPHAPYTVGDDDLRLASDLARSLGVRIHIHAAENMQQTESSLERLGCTPMTVLERTGILDAGVLIAHGGGIVASDREVLEPAAERVSVACCPKVYFKHDIDPITPVRLLHEWGISVGAGTDGAAGGNTLDVWEAMRWTALAQKRQEHDPLFLPVSDAFALGTRGGATAASHSNAGVLRAGAVADIVLVDVSGPHCQPIHDLTATLVYSVRASDVHSVIVDGELVVRARQLCNAELAEIVEEARATAPELVKIRPGEAVQHYAP